MEKILIVDGSNLLFQMYYGMPARIFNRQGRPIHGTIGFLGALLKMIRRVEATYVAVFFDGECANPRGDLDENYKANREDYSQLPEEETPFSQLPDIFAALDYLGIRYRETTDCEADDWIAGYAFRYGNEHNVTIASQDSDFFQLIGPNVSILRYRGENSVLCDREWLWEKLGVEPKQYADYKAMVGDNADNIRGADKIGAKTAAQLLQQFDSLDAVFQSLDQVKKPSVRNSLAANKDRLRLNQLLIRLDDQHDLPLSLQEMRYQEKGLTSTQVLRALEIQ